MLHQTSDLYLGAFIMNDTELLNAINKYRLHPLPSSFLGGEYWRCLWTPSSSSTS